VSPSLRSIISVIVVAEAGLSAVGEEYDLEGEGGSSGSANVVAEWLVGVSGFGREGAEQGCGSVFVRGPKEAVGDVEDGGGGERVGWWIAVGPHCLGLSRCRSSFEVSVVPLLGFDVQSLGQGGGRRVVPCFGRWPTRLSLLANYGVTAHGTRRLAPGHYARRRVPLAVSAPRRSCSTEPW
jgi:hypothetical protein